MKKFFKSILSVICIFAVALPVTSCAHEHKWGEWQRTETEHWRVCTVCKEEQRGTHEDHVCSVCAEFKALALGFDEIGAGFDDAHADFAQDANKWFSEKGKELGFTYEFSKDFSKLNDNDLANYDLVMFLNNRPYGKDQQAAFERFMENGGAWMGFHCCTFSMIDDKENNPDYWAWYQDEFVGCGNYVKNTWNPTSEPLKVETYNHPATENLYPEDGTIKSAPCEWYGWEYDLFGNDDITVLLTLNPTKENPAGDNPTPGKEYEIWYEGCYPIAWANKNYNMVYMNWGHNLRPYNNGTEGTKSSTFTSEDQNKFMIDAMFGLTKK